MALTWGSLWIHSHPTRTGYRQESTAFPGFGHRAPENSRGLPSGAERLSPVSCANNYLGLFKKNPKEMYFQIWRGNWINLMLPFGSRLECKPCSSRLHLGVCKNAGKFALASFPEGWTPQEMVSSEVVFVKTSHSSNFVTDTQLSCLW